MLDFRYRRHGKTGFGKKVHIRGFVNEPTICEKYKNVLSKTTCSMALVLATDVASDSGPLPSFSQILNLECHMVNIFLYWENKNIIFLV